MEAIKRQASIVMFGGDRNNLEERLFDLKEPFIPSNIDLEAPPLLGRSQSTKEEEEAIRESLALLHQKSSELNDNMPLDQLGRLEMERKLKAVKPDLNPIVIRFVLKTVGYSSVYDAVKYLERQDNGLFVHVYHGSNGLCLLCHCEERMHMDPNVIFIKTETQMCPICYEEFGLDATDMLNCGHTFHQQCIQETMKVYVSENKMNLLVCPEAACRS